MTNETFTGDKISSVTTSFWVIGIIALLWNLAGFSAFIFDMMKGDEALALMSEAERSLYENNPLWHKIVYGIATACGVLGAIALLMKRKWAINLFLISLIAVIIQFLYGVFGTNVKEVYGIVAAIFPMLIALFGAFLVYYARKCNSRGWLS